MLAFMIQTNMMMRRGIYGGVLENRYSWWYVREGKRGRMRRGVCSGVYENWYLWLCAQEDVFMVVFMRRGFYSCVHRKRYL